MEDKDYILRQAQLRMLDILLEVDRVCRENHIEYWIDAGTLLGAVRHKGFIPWDDDIDICMLENEYKRFLENAPKELNYEKYFLQARNTDLKMPLKSAKVRDRNSVLIEESELSTEKHHQGIYIDIFPMSYLKNINKLTFGVYSILTKVKDLNPYAGNNRKQKLILKYLGLIWIAQKLSKYFFTIKETDKIGYKHLYKNTQKIENIFPLKKIEFEGYKFPCPNNVDIYLKELYGNTYMELPSEKDRVWHAKEIRLNESCFFEKELKKLGKNLYID